MGEVERSTAVDKELGTGRGPIIQTKIIPETNNAIAKKQSPFQNTTDKVLPKLLTCVLMRHVLDRGTLSCLENQYPISFISPLPDTRLSRPSSSSRLRDPRPRAWHRPTWSRCLACASRDGQSASAPRGTSDRAQCQHRFSGSWEGLKRSSLRICWTSRTLSACSWIFRTASSSTRPAHSDSRNAPRRHVAYETRNTSC